jgi:hypothetical protein
MSTISQPNDDFDHHPRLDEDAPVLLRESVLRLEALETLCAHALLEDDHASLIEAAGHAIVMSSKARRLLSFAVHVDLEAVA